MERIQLVPILRWLTELAQEADGARSLSARVFEDEAIGACFGHVADRCIQVRVYVLTTLCSREQQACFEQERLTAAFQPLPETYLAHREHLDLLLMRISPTPPLYRLRLLGKALDLFYELMSLGHALVAHAYDRELYEGQLNLLFGCYNAVRDAIKGEEPAAWDEIHEALDLLASSRPKWETRWSHFSNPAAWPSRVVGTQASITP